MFLREVDIYRTAKLLIERYGDEAPAFADNRVRYWLHRNDQRAQETWRSILRAVEILNLFGPASFQLLH